MSSPIHVPGRLSGRASPCCPSLPSSIYFILIVGVRKLAVRDASLANFVDIRLHITFLVRLEIRLDVWVQITFTQG